MALEATFISPFAMGAIEVLKVQVGCSVSVGESYRVDLKEVYFGDVTGEININSDVFKGVMAVSFPEATYLKVMSKLFGNEYSSFVPEIGDGVCEFANMIFGHAKRLLTDRGRKMEMALPRMVHGKKAPADPSLGRFRIVLTTDLGLFAIEMIEKPS
jgi:CheY-specific phosphatase CheX